jgi:PleD family two-component response regulator
MASLSPEQERIARQAREVFLSARKTISANWNRDQARELYELSDSLSEQAQEASLDDLGECLLGFSAYLSSFVDTSLSPKPSQLGQLSILIESIGESLFRLQMDVSVADLNHESAVMEPDRPQIYYLGQRSERAKELDWALAERGFSVKVAASAAQVFADASSAQVQAVLVDIEQLQSWQVAAGSRGGGKDAMLPPMIVLSDSDELELRLRAIRSGADQFFVYDADKSKIGQRLQELVDDRRKPYQVLIIDDDLSMTMFVDSVLRHNGMVTCVLNSPANALKVLEDFRPDVILADLYMPDITGLELLALYRSHQKTVFTPVILLSGDDDTEKRFDALHFGGDDYLTKPIRPRHLVAAVTNRARRARWQQRELLAAKKET